MTTLTTGLVSYWKLDSDATDSVSSNDGTISGATLVAGKINNCYEFDAEGEKINIPSVTGLSGTSAGTISCWFKTDDITTFQTLFNGVDLSFATTYVSTRISAGGVGIQQRNAGDQVDTVISDSDVLISGAWYHFVAGSTGTAYFLYLNGVELDKTINAGSDNGDWFDSSPLIDALQISGRIGTGQYTGLIDEIGVWDRALSEAEILELYNSGTGNQYPFISEETTTEEFRTMELLNVELDTRSTGAATATDDIRHFYVTPGTDGNLFFLTSKPCSA